MSSKAQTTIKKKVKDPTKKTKSSKAKTETETKLNSDKSKTNDASSTRKKGLYKFFIKI